MSPIARLALAGALVAAPAAAWAHHGWRSYSEAEPAKTSGTLNDVAWGNTRGTAKMNWQDKEWDVVLAPVTRMTARDASLEEIDKGQQVTLTGYVRRDGTTEMRIGGIK